MPAAQRISFEVTDEEGVIAYNPHCINKKEGIAVNFPVKMVVWANDEDIEFDTWDSVEQGLRRQFETAMEAPDEDGKVYYIDADEVFYSDYEPEYRDGEGFSNVEEYIEWYKEQIKDSEVDRDSSYGGAIVNLTKEGALDEVELGSLEFFEVDSEDYEDEDDDGYVDFDDVADVYNDFVDNVCEEAGYPEELDEDSIYDDFCNLLDEWNEGAGRDEYKDVRDYLDAHLDVDDYLPEEEEDEEDEDEDEEDDE